MKIHQDAVLSRIDLSKGTSFDYQVQSPNHGVYVMTIQGALQIGDDILQKRDALGVLETEKFTIKASEDAEILFIEVPM